MRAYFQRNALLILAAAVCAVMVMFYVAGHNARSEETAAQEAEIAELDTRLQTVLAEEEAEQQAAVDNALGTSDERVQADTVLIREFVRGAVTWDSGESYTQARDSVLRRYGLDEGSQFLQVYFPEPIYNTDTSGNRYYVVDTKKLNSSLDSVKVQPLGVSGTEYRYMVTAEISAKTAVDGHRASNTSVIYLTLDGEGTFSDVSGFASVAGPLRSK